MSLLLELPLMGLRQVVPSAFEIVGGFTPETGAVLVKLQDCEKTLDNGTVYGPGRLLETWVFVEPKNTSWSVEGYVNRYLLEAAVDQPGVLQFLANRSLNATLASFTETELSSPAGASLHVWTADAGTWKATFDLLLVKDPTPQDLTRRWSLWYGAGPFARIAREQAHTAESLPTAGALIVTGESGLRSAMMTPSAPHLGGLDRDGDNLFQFDGKWYA